MADNGDLRRELASKGLFVIVGIVYALWGPPMVGLDPMFIGSAVAAYGLVSFVGNRVIGRWGLLGR